MGRGQVGVAGLDELGIAMLIWFSTHHSVRRGEAGVTPKDVYGSRV